MPAALLTADELPDAARLRLALSVFQHAGEGILITDARARILAVNPAFSAITGYASHEVKGRTPKLLSSGHHDRAFYADMRRALAAEGCWSGEIWNRRKDGNTYPELLRIVTVRDEAGMPTHYVGLFADLSMQKQQQASLERRAHYDELTGLPNRALLLERLAMALARAQRQSARLAVCYLDLDGFNEVNERHGSAAGDELLLHVAERLRNVVRAGDAIARIGGDEFVLLLADAPPAAEVALVVERVRQALAAPYALQSATVEPDASSQAQEPHHPGPAAARVSARISASLGIALFPEHGRTPEHLLRAADQAMYRAKRLGKDRVCFVDGDDGVDEARLQRERGNAELRRGLLAGELVLHYQPKVDARTRALLGVEALVRWQHPQRGLVPPGEFLPGVAGTPLEVELDLWVLEQALAQLARWQAQGLALTVCVNLTAQTLGRRDLAELLAGRIAASGARAEGCFEIEVLETAALSDVRGAVQAIEACAALGVRFALDDFGTGYSSLAYLRQLPVHTLKIDQSFVRRMLENASDMHIVKAVIGLARAFGVQTVAEGVETEAHAGALAELGCDVLQGYGIARPMAAAALPGWACGRALAG